MLFKREKKTKSEMESPALSSSDSLVQCSPRFAQKNVSLGSPAIGSDFGKSDPDRSAEKSFSKASQKLAKEVFTSNTKGDADATRSRSARTHCFFNFAESSILAFCVYYERPKRSKSPGEGTDFIL